MKDVVETKLEKKRETSRRLEALNLEQQRQHSKWLRKIRAEWRRCGEQSPKP